jgi:hypothetical protein
MPIGKKIISYQLNENELKALFRLVEAERELAYHLVKYKESLELRLEELKHLTAKASEVQRIKHGWDWKQFSSLTEEQKKAINNILQSKHIKV